MMWITEQYTLWAAIVLYTASLKTTSGKIKKPSLPQWGTRTDKTNTCGTTLLAALAAAQTRRAITLPAYNAGMRQKILGLFYKCLSHCPLRSICRPALHPASSQWRDSL